RYYRTLPIIFTWVLITAWIVLGVKIIKKMKDAFGHNFALNVAWFFISLGGILFVGYIFGSLSPIDYASQYLAVKIEGITTFIVHWGKMILVSGVIGVLLFFGFLKKKLGPSDLSTRLITIGIAAAFGIYLFVVANMTQYFPLVIFIAILATLHTIGWASSKKVGCVFAMGLVLLGILWLLYIAIPHFPDLNQTVNQWASATPSPTAVATVTPSTPGNASQTTTDSLVGYFTFFILVVIITLSQVFGGRVRSASRAIDAFLAGLVALGIAGISFGVAVTSGWIVPFIILLAVAGLVSGLAGIFFITQGIAIIHALVTHGGIRGSPWYKYLTTPIATPESIAISEQDNNALNILAQSKYSILRFIADSIKNRHEPIHIQGNFLGKGEPAAYFNQALYLIPDIIGLFIKALSPTLPVRQVGVAGKNTLDIDGEGTQPLLKRKITGTLAAIKNHRGIVVAVLALAGLVVAISNGLITAASLAALPSQAQNLLILVKPELINLLNAFLGVNLLWFGWQGTGWLINQVLVKFGLRNPPLKNSPAQPYAPMVEVALDKVLKGKPKVTAAQRDAIRERLDLLVLQHYGNKQSAKYQVTSLVFGPFLRVIERKAPAAYPFINLILRFIGDVVDLVLILPVLYKFALRYGFIRFGYANMILSQQNMLTPEELSYLAKQALRKEGLREKLSLGSSLDKKLIHALRQYNGSLRQRISTYALATKGSFYALISTRVLLKLISSMLVQPLLMVFFPATFLATPLFTIPALTILGISILTTAMPINVSAVLGAFFVVLILDLWNGVQLWHNFKMHQEQHGTIYAIFALVVELFEGVEGMILVNSEIEAAINFSAGIGNALDTAIGNLIGVPLSEMLISPGKLVSSPVLAMEQWIYGAEGHISIGDVVWNPLEAIFGRVVLGRDNFELGQAVYGLGRSLLGREDLPESLQASQAMVQMLTSERNIAREISESIKAGELSTPKDIAGKE
ncbi:MAG: hypothetical protein COV73_01995, partial [Candidatus Omnitrophica bacterium CG11_big_fil_rev_8_21_14_0_20_43_6]